MNTIKTSWNGVSATTVNGPYGRESNNNYMDADNVKFFGDWHYKSAALTRPTRAANSWQANTSSFNTNLIAMDNTVTPVYTKTTETSFRQSTLLNDWTLFSEQFASSIRTGANF